MIAGGASTTNPTRLAIASPLRPGHRAPVCLLSRMYAAHAAAASRANSAPRSVRPTGLKPSSATPSPARPTQIRSRGRRDPITATVNGPRNSMVTATPSGISAKDW